MSDKTETTIKSQGIDSCWGVVMNVPRRELEAIRQVFLQAAEAQDEYAIEVFVRLNILTGESGDRPAS